MNKVVQQILDIAMAVSCNEHVSINHQTLKMVAKYEMLKNPLPIKQVLVDSETIFYSPSLLGNTEEIPLELIRINNDFLA